MKNRVLFTVLTAVIQLFFGCQEWERNYENINDEFARSLSMQFLEPDIATGDTVTIRTVWSGQRVTPSDLKWDVSWQVFTDLYGKEIVLDRESLEPYIVTAAHEVSRNEVTQVFEMEIAIPDSVIYKSSGIPDTWTDMLIPYGIDINPEVFGISRNKDSLLMQLDSLSELSDETLAQIPLAMGYQLNGLCQFLAANFKVYCDYSASGGFKGSINHRVRYHSKLEAIPGVFVNHRPVQTAWRIYEVEGDPTTFYSSSDNALDTFEIVNDSVEFVYDENRSYFLECDLDRRDSTITTGQAFTTQESSFEQFSGYWFYDDSAYVSIGMAEQEDGTYQKAGNPQIVYKLFMGDDPVKNRPLHFWFENFDFKLASGIRPNGRDLREFDITLL